MEQHTLKRPKREAPRRQLRQARLILEDGSEFRGFSFGRARSQAGEVVFTTAMTGLPQILTDPGCHGQILAASYPLATDSGIPVKPKTYEAFLDKAGVPLHLESPVVQAAGLAISELCEEPNPSGPTLSAWLEKNNVPGIFGIDTRALVKRLRDYGPMRGKILVDGTRDVTLDSGIIVNPVEEVSSPGSQSFLPLERKEGKSPKIVLIDCGAKAGIIRSLLNRNAEVLRLGWNNDLKGVEFDGLVLSGGPGDPKACGRTIAMVRRAFDLEKPIFGIGLGMNIMALAAGADTYRLPFGHRGINQPCIELGTSRCYITSQNHGYAVRKESLPKSWDIWFTNANDNSAEGIRSNRSPFSAVQFYPEGCPGPRDTGFLFDRFLGQVKEANNA